MRDKRGDGNAAASAVRAKAIKAVASELRTAIALAQAEGTAEAAQKMAALEARLRAGGGNGKADHQSDAATLAADRYGSAVAKIPTAGDDRYRCRRRRGHYKR